MKSLPDVKSASNRTGMEGEQTPVVTRVVDPLSIADWDAQIARIEGASFFHTAAWARVLEGTYGYKPLYLVSTQEGSIRGLLPLMEVNSWVTGKRGVSLPFSDECPPIGSGVGALVAEMRRMGEERGWKYWEVRGGEAPEAGAEPSISFFEHSLQLGAEEKIFSGLEGSVRRAIRKAEKEGVSVEVATSLEAVRTFYELHCRTRQKHGVPPQPFEFFANFQRHVLAHNLGFVVIARHGGMPIAASVFVHFGSEAIYKYGASDEKFKHFRGANLVMWHGIQRLTRAGFHRLGFGRTSQGNEGLRRFKLGWGAEERLLSYFRFDLPGNQYVTGLDDAPGLANKAVSLMPVSLAKVTGHFMYRHVG